MIPKELLYAKTHEWARIEDGVAVVGITDFAQEQLGDLTFIELPAVGDSFSAGDEIGTVESVKAASEIYAPVSGEVTGVNQQLDAAPETVNQDPYQTGWMVKFKISDRPDDLMTAADYQDFIAEED